VKDHGTEVTGIKGDIKANSDAIDAIEADYLKAADKTELNGKITGLDTRMGAAETAIGTKAAQADHDALAGRVTTAEGKITTLEGEMDTAQGDITGLKGLVGDKSVATQIEAAITALKIGDYAKAADLTAAIERIAKNEGDISGLTTRMGTAEGKIGALETEVGGLAAIAKSGSTDDLVQGDMILVFDCGTSAV
jgi:predicted  nucleic acid-binding Zn-ribbon protein